MTEDEIKHMARQIGFITFKSPELITEDEWKNIEELAKLIAEMQDQSGHKA